VCWVLPHRLHIAVSKYQRRLSLEPPGIKDIPIQPDDYGYSSK